MGSGAPIVGGSSNARSCRHGRGWTDGRTGTGQAPHWPRCAASAAVFRGEQVRLIERGKGTLQALRSLPGGHIEAGETVRAAALREVREETGPAAEPAGLVDIDEVIRHGPGDTLRPTT